MRRPTTMAKKNSENRLVITLRSESGHTYTTTKSNDPARMELKKYDPRVRQHVVFKETK